MIKKNNETHDQLETIAKSKLVLLRENVNFFMWSIHEKRGSALFFTNQTKRERKKNKKL